ncbi:alpha-D-ribose 1-methylphosphonate 5-triphosphate diphosphatase [Hwanghaeella grinnelliae]|nr:alpha-D-ribose 1-methylphosphonate 5-triphosphate diphosphatase [Hwanghaeella grinnelliae]
MTTIVNGQVLLPSGDFAETSVRLDGDHIAGLGGASDGREIDATGLWVLPGMIDIHGDAFERQMMPRPGVHVDHAIAFMDTDRQLVSNGITTAFHGITYSWEPGLRGAEQCRSVLDAIEELRPSFGCDARTHLRWETYNLDAVEEVAEWIAAGRIDLLAFNDHAPTILKRVLSPEKKKLGEYTGRTGLTEQDFVDLAKRVAARKDDVPGAIERLAAAAVKAGVAQLSHDDTTAETRGWYNGLGCTVAEFPMTDEAADEALRLGNPIVLGAPNVMRGGSHNGSLDAAVNVAAGRCDILASDYYYPSMLAAAFRLVRDGRCSFPEAWARVSRNPALAAGLSDRGEIAQGARADLVLVDPETSAGPQVRATIAGGAIVYDSGPARNGI